MSCGLSESSSPDPKQRRQAPSNLLCIVDNSYQSSCFRISGMTPHQSEHFLRLKLCIHAMESAGEETTPRYCIASRNTSFMMSRWLSGATDYLPPGSSFHFGSCMILKIYSVSHAQILVKNLPKNIHVQLTYSPEVNEGFKIQIDSMEVYLSVVDILLRAYIPYNCFQWKDSDILQVVICGLKENVSMKHVNDTMLKMGYPIISVYRRNNARDKNGALPIFVDVLRTNPGMQIFRLNYLLSSKVKVTKYFVKPINIFGIPNIMKLRVVD